MEKIFEAFKVKVKAIKRDTGALYLAYKRKDVSLFAKFLTILVVGYALSPVDLIPDFIPILGYIDDLIIVPLGITLAVKLIPKEIMAECRDEAENIFKEGKPKNWLAGAIIICVWVMILGYIIYKIYKASVSY